MALLAALAFLPLFQTWVGNLMIAHYPDLHGSMGSLSVGFNEVDVEDLHLEFGSAVLTVPSLQAKVSAIDWLRQRSVRVRTLVAAGWTLELRAPPEAAGGTGTRQPTADPGASTGAITGGQPAGTGRVRGLLERWALPWPDSLEGVDVAGEVRIVAADTATGSEPIRIQVSAQGGGLDAGREGDFAVAASATGPGLPANTLAARGRVRVGLLKSRALGRASLEADLTARGGAMATELDETIHLAIERDAGGGEHYSLDIVNGPRHLATIDGQLAQTGGSVTGAWKVDLSDGDVRPFHPDLPWPRFRAAGEGRFEAGSEGRRIRASGRLDAVVSQWTGLPRWLKPLDSARIGATFDATHDGTTLQITALRTEVTASGQSPGPLLAAESLQPFVWDERTRTLAVSAPASDWIEASVHRLPLSWLSAPSEEWTFAGGDLSGHFRIRYAQGAFALNSIAPLIGVGATVQRAGRALGSGLDFSLAAKAEASDRGWRVAAAPLIVSRLGRPVATIGIEVAQSREVDAPVAVTGSWSADLDALAATAPPTKSGWIRGRAASGTFSATVGPATSLESAFRVAGHNPADAFSGSVRARIEADHTVTFRAPLTLALGGGSTDCSVDGTWTDDAADGQIELSVVGQDVALERLRPLAAAWASATLPSEVPSPGAHSPLPFWGDWVGRATFALARLRAGAQDYTSVGGTLEFDHHRLRLKSGRGELPHHRLVTWDGAVTFGDAPGAPYTLTAAAGTSDIDVAALIPAPEPGEDSVVEGHFSVARTLSGSGAGWQDLMAHTRTTVRLSSAGGIVRWFKSNVADGIPQASNATADALGTMGSVVGSLFGVKRGSLEPARNRLGAHAEAVLEFSNQVAEIGYDSITATAEEQPDGSFRLSGISLQAPHVFATGSGRFGWRAGLALGAQPLSLDLRIGGRGRIAELLTQSGLPLTPAVAPGTAVLGETFHFGGTLEHPDRSQWHDRLAQAANRPAEKPR